MGFPWGREVLGERVFGGEPGKAHGGEEHHDLLIPSYAAARKPAFGGGSD